VRKRTISGGVMMPQKALLMMYREGFKSQIDQRNVMWASVRHKSLSWTIALSEAAVSAYCNAAQLQL
jgi:hypothetical protein